MNPDSYLRYRARVPELGSTGLARELLRPYVDLVESPAGPLHATVIPVVLELFQAPDTVRYPTQVHPPVDFRAMLVATIAPDHQCASPELLPERLWSDAWRAVAEAVHRYRSLDPEVRLRFLAVLGRLSFYQATLRLQPDVDDDDLRAHASYGGVALKVANARKKVRAADDDISLLARTVTNSIDPSARLSAACTLVVEHCRARHRDPAAARGWADVAAREFAAMRWSDPFQAAVETSTYWRAVSFASFLEGDRSRTKRELEEAEAAAHEARPSNRVQHAIWAENLHPLLESRVKEALWLGDVDDAVDRAERLARHDPWDAKVRILLGDVLARAGRVDRAGDEYATAASYGPPYGAAAWYRLGRLRERTGELDAASDAYFRSAVEDPAAHSPLRRLTEVAGNSPYGRWARQQRELRTARLGG